MEEQNIILEERKSPNYKIFIAAVAIVIILAIVLFVVFSSPIPKDYKKLRQNLRDEDYYVVSSTSRDEILEALGEMLDGMFYYEDEGLEDELYKLINKSGLNEHEMTELSKGIDCVVLGVDEYNENYILSLYFEDKSSAKEFFLLFQPLFDFVKENGSDGDMFENIKRSDFTFGQNGKIIYIGTKDALKASK